MSEGEDAGLSDAQSIDDEVLADLRRGRKSDLAELGSDQSGEPLPHADNRVTLDSDVKDKWGIPAARIDVRWRANEQAMDKDMMTAGAELRTRGDKL